MAYDPVAHDLLLLLVQYGLLLVFLNVLVEQAGLPLPAVPTLVVAGALSARGELPLAGVVIVAVAACLVSDSLWYLAGRRYGSGVMRMLCRISLSPDSCVRQSELRFARWRGGMLLIAKFVPGLSTLAPPLVGAMGLRPGTFLLFDALGAALWAGLAAGLGYAFATQIDHVLALLVQAGTLALEMLITLLVLYIAVRYWRRRRLLRELDMERITVDELAGAISAREPPVLIDVRSPAARALDPRILPGAVLIDDARHPALALLNLSRQAQLVTYCNCPHEVSAAQVAKRLRRAGFLHVRPLLGGLDAWDTAGKPLDRLAPSELDPQAVQAVDSVSG